MTFDARELSLETGKPVFLAEFTLGGVIWRHARADEDVEHGGHVYTGISMKSTDIVDSGEIGKNEIRLEVPRSHPIAELWRTSPPASTVGAVLKEIHAGEIDDEVAWLGHVANVMWPNQEKAQISLQSGIIALEANGLRRLFQRPCTHVFGGPKCRKDLTPVTHQVTLASVSGFLLTSPGFAAAGKLAGGFIRWTDVNGITDWKFVIEHNAGSATVKLLTPAPFLTAGMVVDAVEGCDHTPQRCTELANIVNFGGLPNFMKKNPFDGNPVY
jgi:uncharacterized phage protein (TIGR02218 family)